MYVVIAIIVFGLMVAIHELGHFISAKALGVRVNEFAIGMGPKILSKQGKETLYSLRVFPFGGFCAMEEDEDAVDGRSFNAQKRWRRIIILAAGSFANLVFAFIIVLILSSQAQVFGGTTITGLVDDFPHKGEGGLMVGDRIVSINGERIFYRDDFALFMSLAGGENIDLIVERDNARVTLNNFPLYLREFIVDGEVQVRYGIYLNLIEATAMQRLRYSAYLTMNYVRIIRVSLAQLISGAVGVRDMSGPVHIVSIMSDIGQEAPTTTAALGNIAGLAAFIMVNLAVMNMLPIPALDGGRIVFIFIAWVVEKISRKPLNPKYERYIHMATFMLLIGFMVFVLINDVVRIVYG